MNKTDFPLVSILLPSYNHESYVQEAIESVFNQSYPNIELIVIDDGSTDGSVEIIESLKLQYDFLFFKQENKGLVRTFEELGRHAKGQYISLFSSDDIYHPQKIERLVDYLERNCQFAMVYSKISLINDNSVRYKDIEESYREGDIFCDLLSGKYFVNGLSALIRAEVYFSYKRFDTYIDDFQFWLAIAKDYQIGFLNEITAFYRVHDNHLSKNLIRMQESEYEILQKYVVEPCYLKAIDYWYLRWFRAFAPCYKIIAIQKFLMKVVLSRNLFSLSFIKGIVRLCLPCKLK